MNGLLYSNLLQGLVLFQVIVSVTLPTVRVGLGPLIQT